MKKKIIIGSILAVFILMMVPSISALQYNTVTESNKSKFMEQINDMDTEEVKDKIKIMGIDEKIEKIQELLPFNFPILTLFLNAILQFRFFQFIVVDAILSILFDVGPWEGRNIIHNIIITVFLARVFIWAGFWSSLGFDISF